MITITQDMRYRLSLIHYDEKFGLTKAVVKYKTNRHTFTAGNAALTAPSSLFVTIPADLITIPTSI